MRTLHCLDGGVGRRRQSDEDISHMTSRQAGRRARCVELKVGNIRPAALQDSDFLSLKPPPEQHVQLHVSV